MSKNLIKPYIAWRTLSCENYKQFKTNKIKKKYVKNCRHEQNIKC